MTSHRTHFGAMHAAWAATAALSLWTGCGNTHSNASKQTADAGTQVGTEAITWYQDVAPIVTEKCAGCHHAGGIAPFSMEKYESAKPFASQMAMAAEEGRMPPFLAQDTAECKPHLPWSNDIRLSADEKKILRAWADADAPAGDPKTAAKVTPPAKVELEREDVIMTIPQKITVKAGPDIHSCVVVDPKLQQDGYVTGRLITAGNPRVLHHVVSYIIKPGTNTDGSARTKSELEAAIKAQKGVGIGGAYPCFGGPGFDGGVSVEMLDAWAPGGIPNLAPDDSGQPIAKDALVLLDMHYHPTGGPDETDSTTKLSLMMRYDEPPRISRTILLGNFKGTSNTQFGVGELLKQKGEKTAEFLIPAGATNHVEEMTWTWTGLAGEIRVMGMGTHMHYVGRDMRITLEHASAGDAGTSECLIETPAWDFNWQRGYGYDAKYEELPTMNNGDVLRLRCVYDNSLDNPFVVQALDAQKLSQPVDVPLGEDTLDEMCLGAFGIIYPNPAALSSK